MYLKLHPLFSHETSLRNSMVILEPENLIYRYITDTTFFGSPGIGATATNAVAAYGSTATSGRLDGTDEEYLTEAGLEFHHPTTMGFLSGVGNDNAL
jgi:hypothetical protein